MDLKYQLTGYPPSPYLVQAGDTIRFTGREFNLHTFFTCILDYSQYKKWRPYGLQSLVGLNFKAGI